MVKQLLVFAILALSLGCKKEGTYPTIPSSQMLTDTIDKNIFLSMQLDTAYTLTTTQYALPTNAYVVRAKSDNGKHEVLIYFYGGKPTAYSSYTLNDNRFNSTLAPGEAFIRYINEGITLYNYASDTLKLSTYKGKNHIEFLNKKFVNDNNSRTRYGHLKISFD